MIYIVTIILSFITCNGQCTYDPADAAFYTMIKYESPTFQYANLNDDCVSIQRSLLNLTNEDNWNDTNHWIADFKQVDGVWVAFVDINITLYWQNLFCDKQQSVKSYMESGIIMCTFLYNILFRNVALLYIHF